MRIPIRIGRHSRDSYEQIAICETFSNEIKIIKIVSTSKIVSTHPITAPRSCPIIETEFDPNDLINCNNSSHILYGVYSLRHCGLSESLKPFKSRATTWKKRDSSLICKIYNLEKYIQFHLKSIERSQCLLNCHYTNTWWNIYEISNKFYLIMPPWLWIKKINNK